MLSARISAHRFSLLLLTSLSLTGCAVYSSVIEDGGVVPHDGHLQGNYMLPRTILNVQIAQVDTGLQLTVSKSVESDPTYRLSYRLETSPLARDVLTVDTGQDGLIKTISSTSTDQTGAIAIKLAELVFTTATGGAPLEGAAPRALPGGSLASGHKFSASYDPLDPIESRRARNGMAAAGFCVLVGADAAHQPDKTCDVPRPTASITEYVQTYVAENPAIYFRRAVPLPVTIYRKKSNEKFDLIFSGNDLFFDKTSLYELKIDRAAFVEKKVEVTFDNGHLQKISVTKDSEVLAFVGIPVRVAQIIFSIPLATLKREKELIDAETGVLTATQKKLEAEAALLKTANAQAAAGATPTVLPTTTTSGSSTPVVVNPARALTPRERFVLCVRESGEDQREACKTGMLQ